MCVSNNQFPKGQKPAGKDSVATQAVKDVPIVRPTAPTSTTPLAPLDPNESKLPLPETKPSNKKFVWGEYGGGRGGDGAIVFLAGMKSGLEMSAVPSVTHIHHPIPLFRGYEV